MSRCQSCGSELMSSAASCGVCDAPVPTMQDDAGSTRLAVPGSTRLAVPDSTRLADADATRLAPGSGSRPSSSGGTGTSGWLSSSGSIDHGRFPPGTLLGGRYRIVGRLGRGGMGEVYRADDLKLGQPVALKFLPPEVDHDPGRLTQLHTEVRMARQVSHPNVCRVYDIDEVDGHTFLSMEFVDGEDLASLLRRIGCFSVDRALTLSRQICAGLAAAHERGVVHRDFKPANVMIDDAGQARITDFGLAGTTGETVRAGTPAYMAPEQLAGSEVTPRSDIYALGLVLYEVFTGRRAIEAKSLAELVRRREEAGIVLPSEIVRDLDPAIDRAILRCLERDPADRPSSALAVSAALPGGDPLAAALAAGETPSPEMVAASGESEALGVIPALSAFVLTLIALALMAFFGDRIVLTGVVPINKPPSVLNDRASEIARQLGYTDMPTDTASGFQAARQFLSYANQHPDTVTRERLASGRPPAVNYWYRRSPEPLLPDGDSRQVGPDDPPVQTPGMMSMLLDPDGRLRRLVVVPPQFEASTNTPATPVPPDWSAMFNAAGLNAADFSHAEPEWTPQVGYDTRAAWVGPIPGWPEQKLRVEAAGFRGRPVYFELIEPWREPPRAGASRPTLTERFWGVIGPLIYFLIVVSAAFVARHNLRKARGDRRTALRVAALVFATSTAGWILGSVHFAELGVEVTRFFAGVGHSLWAAALVWVMYVALEPYVRRFWPSTLTSWSRLQGGKWRDPIVGRDVLVGSAFGCVIAASLPAYAMLTARYGYNVVAVDLPRFSDLSGVRFVAASLGDYGFSILFNSLWVVFGLVMLRLLFRRPWIVGVAAVGLFLLSSDIVQSGPPQLRFAMSVAVLAAIVYLAMRFGLLAITTFFFMNFVIASAVLTLDPAKWFFPTSVWLVGVGAVVAAFGYYVSRGGEPLLGRRILD